MIFTINKLPTGEYLNTSKVIKSVAPDYAAVVNSDKLKEALSLISVAALSGEKKEPINLVMAGGEIVVSCNSSFSEAGIGVAAKVTRSTPDTGFYYDVSALLKLFQVIGGNVKIEINTEGYMLVKTPREIYFQLPVRAPAKNAKPAKQDKDKGGSQSEQKDKKQKEQKEQKRAKGADDVKEVA